MQQGVIIVIFRRGDQNRGYSENAKSDPVTLI